MTSGNCVFGCGFQADLDGHYYSYHHMSMPTSAVTPPKVPSTQPLGQITPQYTAPTAHDPKKYCSSCGQKLGAQTWREVVIAFVRYQMMVFWIGSFVGSLFGIEVAHLIYGPHLP